MSQILIEINEILVINIKVSLPEDKQHFVYNEPDFGFNEPDFA